MTQLCFRPLSFQHTQIHQQTHLNTKATHKNTEKPSPTRRITPLTNILMALTVLSFCQTIMFYHKHLCAKLPALLQKTKQSSQTRTTTNTLTLDPKTNTVPAFYVLRCASALCKPETISYRIRQLLSFTADRALAPPDRRLRMKIKC